MLKIEKEMLPDCQAKLTVTVEPERVQQELQAAAVRISKSVNIPGFRKGKAPYHIILRYFGEDAVFEEALEPLGQAVYSEALEQSELDPYAPGALSDMTRDPLVFTFMIPLEPEIDLGAYREVRIPYKVEKVTNEDVEHAIDNLLEQQATLERVERSVEWDDVATLDIVGTEVEGKGKKSKVEPEESDEREHLIERKGAKVLIAKKATYPVPGFPEEIVGMSVGDNRSFDIKLPAKSKTIGEELRGKTIHFEVSCSEVYSREVPPLDDEFAKSAGDYADLAELRAKTREQLEEAAKETTRSNYIDEVVDHLLSSVVKITYPPVMLKEQIDNMVEDFGRRLERQGLKLDDYLRLNNLPKEGLQKDFEPVARTQIARALLMSEVSEAERLVVSEEEINDEIETRLLSFGAQAETARPFLNSPEARRSLASSMLFEKALERLSLIARGEAPPLEPAPISDEVPTESPAK